MIQTSISPIVQLDSQMSTTKGQLHDITCGSHIPSFNISKNLIKVLMNKKYLKKYLVFTTFPLKEFRPQNLNTYLN